MTPQLTDGTEKRWTVFVGSAEVLDYLADFKTAGIVAEEYRDSGYDDVALLQYDTGEELRV